MNAIYFKTGSESETRSKNVPRWWKEKRERERKNWNELLFCNDSWMVERNAQATRIETGNGEYFHRKMFPKISSASGMLSFIFEWIDQTNNAGFVHVFVIVLFVRDKELGERERERMIQNQKYIFFHHFFLLLSSPPCSRIFIFGIQDSWKKKKLD